MYNKILSLARRPHFADPWFKSNYYFNNKKNISQNNEYRDIIKDDNHHVNFYTQNQNI